MGHACGADTADPAETVQAAEMVRAVRRVVGTGLSDHQRRVVVAIVLQGVPLDVLVEELDSNRNAIYKCLFDARPGVAVHLAICGPCADDYLGLLALLHDEAQTSQLT